MIGRPASGTQSAPWIAANSTWSLLPLPLCPAQYWAAHVEAAQAPHPLSARDGRLIKPVPHSERLPPPELLAHLEAALHPLQDEVGRAAGALATGWWTRGP